MYLQGQCLVASSRTTTSETVHRFESRLNVIYVGHTSSRGHIVSALAPPDVLFYYNPAIACRINASRLQKRDFDIDIDMSADGVEPTASNRGPLLNIATWLVLVLMCIPALAKLGAKWGLIRNLQYDDAFTILAMVCGPSAGFYGSFVTHDLVL